jgi:hypothetical protein
MKTLAERKPNFETHCDPIDVTSIHRPNTGWTFTDTKGHTHRWHFEGDGEIKPATEYNPRLSYFVPTIHFVQDGVRYYEDDDEPTPYGHYECNECGARVEPGYCADACRTYIPGLIYYKIDGRPVTKEEFDRELYQHYPEMKPKA